MRLRRAQLVEQNCRHLAPAELARSKQPAVPGYDLGLGANQNRDIQSEGSNAFGELSDPVASVRMGVFWVALQLIDTPPDHCQGRSWNWRGFVDAGFHNPMLLTQIPIIVNLI